MICLLKISQVFAKESNECKNYVDFVSKYSICSPPFIGEFYNFRDKKSIHILVECNRKRFWKYISRADQVSNGIKEILMWMI